MTRIQCLKVKVPVTSQENMSLVVTQQEALSECKPLPRQLNLCIYFERKFLFSLLPFQYTWHNFEYSYCYLLFMWIQYMCSIHSIV